MYKTFSARLGAVVLSAFCAVCAQAQSIVVLDQLPEPGDYANILLSDASCQSGSPPIAISSSVADDFRVQPPSGQTTLEIVTVQFIGAYMSGIDVDPANPPPFVLRIRNEHVVTHLPNEIQAVLTPTNVSVQALGNGVFQFSVDVEPVTLGPGLYWLELAENGTTTDCWHWAIGRLDAANGLDAYAVNPVFSDPAGWRWPIIPDDQGRNAAIRILAAVPTPVPPAPPPAPTPVPSLAREGLFLLGGLLMLVVFWQRRGLKP